MRPDTPPHTGEGPRTAKFFAMKQLLPLLFLFGSALALAQDASLQTVASNDTEAAAPAARTAVRFTQQHFDVMAKISYLQDMPADKEPEKRRETAAYVTSWVASNPDVNLEIPEKIEPYLKYGEAEAIFMGAYAQFHLTHPTTDYVAANIAGIFSVLSYYMDNKEVLGFNVVLEKLINLRDKGRLRGFIKRRVS